MCRWCAACAQKLLSSGVVEGLNNILDRSLNDLRAFELDPRSGGSPGRYEGCPSRLLALGSGPDWFALVVGLGAALKGIAATTTVSGREGVGQVNEFR